MDLTNVTSVEPPLKEMKMRDETFGDSFLMDSKYFESQELEERRLFVEQYDSICKKLIVQAQNECELKRKANEKLRKELLEKELNMIIMGEELAKATRERDAYKQLFKEEKKASAGNFRMLQRTMMPGSSNSMATLPIVRRHVDASDLYDSIQPQSCNGLPFVCQNHKLKRTSNMLSSESIYSTQQQQQQEEQQQPFDKRMRLAAETNFEIEIETILAKKKLSLWKKMRNKLTPTSGLRAKKARKAIKK